MKKFCIVSLFILCILCLPVYADDTDLGDYAQDVDNAWYGQKPVTDETFENTIKKLEDKKNKKKKNEKEGESLYKGEQQSDYLNVLSTQTVLLSVPLELITNNGSEILPEHYKIEGKMKKNKVYLEFWQSHFLIATVEAKETNDDFKQKNINFAKVLPYNESHVKVIFGSVDFNAYVLISKYKRTF